MCVNRSLSKFFLIVSNILKNLEKLSFGNEDIISKKYLENIKIKIVIGKHNV